MEYTCSRERFLKDVKTHEMHIMLDNGLYRHVRFKRPNTGTYYFDLVTWAGHLVICGDAGDFHFSREEDMFGWFNHNIYDFDHEHIINPQYWGQKLQGNRSYTATGLRRDI